MWTCPACGLVNLDSSVLCDCKKGAPSAGYPGRVGPSPIPWVVWVHLGVVGLLSLYLGYSDLTRPPRRYQWQPTESQQQLQSGLFWLRTVVLIPLYLAFLSGKNWARLAVGIVTLPIGLLLLVPRTVRRYTGAIAEEPMPGGVLHLDK